MKNYKSGFFFIAIAFASCTSTPQKDSAVKTDSVATKPVADTVKPDTIFLKETFSEDDVVPNDYLADKLTPIRENYKRINSITQWSFVLKKNTWDSTESGIATYYSFNGNLEKIVERTFGEMYQSATEFYLQNGKLSFVFERLLKYNRPINYDSAAMKMNKDDEVFDIEKSEVVEGRYYFDNGKLIHQICSEDDESEDGGLAKNKKRLLSDFEKLLQLKDKN